MSSIEENVQNIWNSNQLLLGVPLIDIQHLWLIVIISQLLEESVSENFELDNQIGAVLNYIDVHFKTEEEILKKLNYPVLAVHASQHQEFVRHINQDLIAEHILDPRSLAKLMRDFLLKWLSSHINVEDKEYNYFIKGKNLDIHQISLELIKEKSIEFSEDQIYFYKKIIGDWII